MRISQVADSLEYQKLKYNPQESKINVFPYRYLQSLQIFHHFLNKKNSQQIFLLDKMDITSKSVCFINSNPVFSCIREGFNDDNNVIGGYLTTNEIEAYQCVGLVEDIINKKKDIPYYQELDKEYVIDWNIFKLQNELNKKDIPSYVKIINQSFYEKNKTSIIVVGVMFLFIFILSFFIFIKTSAINKKQRISIKLLEEGHQRLLTAIKGSNSSTWSYEDDKIIFDENITNIFPYSTNPVSFETLLKGIHPEDIKSFNALKYNILTKHNSEEEFKHQLRIYCKSKECYQWVEIRYCFVHNNNKEVVAGLMIDIQDAKMHEIELIEAKKMAEQAELKQSFLANMSHEIRTPLNTIVGFSDLLASDEEYTPEEKDEFIKTINRNNDLLLNIINEVLEISRIESKQVEFKIKEIEINSFIRECYLNNKLTIKPELDFISKSPEDTPNIYFNADKLRLSQVVTNLIKNANKFTTKGYIELGWNWDNSKEDLTIYVKDTGKGIPEKELKMIFNRFYKVDEFAQGTGLGLSICEIIVKELNGEIKVHSQVDQGSVFSIVLPGRC